MRKTLKISLLIGTLLVLGNIQSSNKDFNESTILDDSEQIALKNIRKANGNGELSHSKIFSQVAYDENNESYFLRFATAIKGDISSISYTRVVEGKEDKITDVSVAYYGITASDTTMYYDSVTQNVSSDASLRGDYYWTCYTIKFNKNSEFITKDISISLKVNDIEIASKTSSVVREKAMQTYTFEAEDAELISLNGKAHIASSDTASGGKYIDGMSSDEAGASLTFKIYAENDCKTNMIIRSIRHYGSERIYDRDCYKVTLNGESINTNLTIKPNTNPDDKATIWTTFYDFKLMNDIEFNKGENIITLTKTSNLTLNLDSIKFESPVKLIWEKDSEYKTYTFEAEDADIYSVNGTVSIGESSSASNGKYIDQMSSESNGASLTFRINAEKDSTANIIVRSIKHPSAERKFDEYYQMSINGNIVKTNLIIEPNTNSSGSTIWTTFYDFRALENISLVAGENIIVLTKCGSVLNLDAIKIESTSVLSIIEPNTLKIEAENTTLSGQARATTESGMNNPSGGKFVGGLSGTVGSMSFILKTEVDCEATLVMCYGNRTNDSTDRKFSSKFVLTLDGNEVSSNVVFNNGTEHNYFGWEEYTICTLNLKAGDNIIKIESKGVTASNVDYFKVNSETKIIFKKA